MEYGSAPYTNRLINESSPYLLQHAHNPVDWHPWGDEAITKAENENKLIFLSIGYSTCHWCHVMEHESFEDEEVAALMNRAYVSIKVDREVRPDLDAVFMETAMMLNRRGGWPLNLILTPDGKPFYAATYIPKTGNSYTAGMMELLPRIEQMWKNEPEKLTSAAEQILRALKAGSTQSETVTASVNPASGIKSTRAAAADMLEKTYDDTFGGFSSSPKFPQPQNLLLLLRRYHETGNTGLLAMAENTLQNMRSGGIYDHIGFGFHRYSTDQRWLLPHFEKMLYDQAMLIIAYTEAYQTTGKKEYRRTVEEIIEYVLRDMRSPEGGFYSAEDADSEGREGKFYVWEYKEFYGLLERGGFTPEQWADYFNLQEDGNFTDEASRIKSGENILHIAPGSAPPDGLDSVRRLLFDERERRVHPHKDDKILTDWNGLMIFALAKAAWSFNEPDWLEAAETAADFILRELKTRDGALLHSYRLGSSGTMGMIDDYAFLIRGLLELYRAGFNPAHIAEAIKLTAYAQKNFEDTAGGGFYQADSKQTDLLIRKKTLMDNAVPSGNSIMYENLMQLFKITGETAWRDSAEGILKTADNGLEKYPSAFAMLISSFDYAGSSGREIIIAGEAEENTELISEINSRFMPGTVVLVKTVENEKLLFELASYTQYYPLPEEQKTAAYVCTEFTCSRPVYNPEELRELLENE